MYFHCSHCWLQGKCTNHLDNERLHRNKNCFFMMDLVYCTKLYLLSGISSLHKSLFYLPWSHPHHKSKFKRRLEIQGVTQQVTLDPIARCPKLCSRQHIPFFIPTLGQIFYSKGKGQCPSLQRKLPLVGSQFVERMKSTARHIEASTI